MFFTEFCKGIDTIGNHKNMKNVNLGGGSKMSGKTFTKSFDKIMMDGEEMTPDEILYELRTTGHTLPSDDEVTKDLFWMIKYMIMETFGVKHTRALKKIICMFNYSKETEQDIFDFAEMIYKKGDE